MTDTAERVDAPVGDDTAGAARTPGDDAAADAPLDPGRVVVTATGTPTATANPAALYRLPPGEPTASGAVRCVVEGLEVLSREPTGDASDARDLGLPPVVFVHGATQAAWVWDEHWMPEAARRGWPCHAVSVRGHGGSAGAETLGTARLRDYVDDVLQVVVRLGDRPVLVGHSMGGRVLQHVLATYPARAGVLVAPIGVRHGYGFFWRLLRQHPGTVLGSLVGRPIRQHGDWMFGPEMDPGHAQAYADRGTDEAQPVLQGLIHWHRPRPSRAPVLVLAGDEDRVIPPVDQVRAARHYGTPAHVFRGMGHSLMLEPRWRQPLDVMLAWLERVAVDR